MRSSTFLLTITIALLTGLLIGCGQAPVAEEAAAPAPQGPKLTVPDREPIVVPEAREVTADDDWEAKAHNKEIEVLQVINTINPVADYVTVGFKEYGDRFSPTLAEEWADTQVQLTKALSLYESCKERKEAGTFDKQLFLDLEEVWQLLVKTGVAGVRSQQMVNAELAKMTG